MPWFIAVLLAGGAIALIAKAILDRKGRYDEPMNQWDGRFDHMMDASSYRDKTLRGQDSVSPSRPPNGADGL